MAALLRHGPASRLASSMLQRALEEERRRLGPRLMHTQQRAHEKIKREVQQKKEDLYDMLSIAERISKTRTWANMRLHQHLSVEITPRPHDSFWCHVQSARRVGSALKKAGLISLPFTVASCLEYCRGYLDDKKVAPGSKP